MVAAIDALASGLDDRAREARIHFANHGRLGDILRGWRGQGEVVRALLGREIIAGRLIPENTGQPLRDLASSEYFATLLDEPQYAIGEIDLYREVTTGSSNGTGVFTGGLIPAGTRFRRPLVQGDIPMVEAEYVSTADVACSANSASSVNLGGGQYEHQQIVSVPIRASRAGEDANCPAYVAGIVADRIFDSAVAAANRFTPLGIYGAGGTSGVTDQQVLALAKAMSRGRFGANNAALVAGVLSDARIRRVAHHLDYLRAHLWLYVADASWATSRTLRDAVQQGISTNKWLGFGAAVRMGRVFNQPCTAKATLILRSTTDNADQEAIKAAAQRAVQRYLDDRPDFYCWRTTQLGAVIAAADPKILTCQNPQLLASGVALTEPPASIADGATQITHYNLRGVDFAFALPGS